jgi:predicted glycogen debranching enzyme
MTHFDLASTNAINHFGIIKDMKAIFRPKPLIRRVPLDLSGMDEQTRSRLGLYSEWIVTNGLGGYASGTVGGLNTRRFHGLLIAALPAPHGRIMMANSLRERFYIGDKQFILGCEDVVLQQQMQSEPETADPVLPTADPINPYLQEFRLEMGLPVWVFCMEEAILEKRVCMVYAQNTSYITYTLLQGTGHLEVQPALHVRPHGGALGGPPHAEYRFGAVEHGFELRVSDDLPVLKFAWNGDWSGFHMDVEQITNLRYRLEQSRGYDWEGGLWSPGRFTAKLSIGKPASLGLSTEDWVRMQALTPVQAFAAEIERRRRLLHAAPEPAREGFAAELVLAADQFLITPVGRTADQVRAHAVGDEVRSLIAGYHWFTDWGRDTMISLEGLALSTGRWREAEYILRSFASYIQNGLIPNLFPEGEISGLYHTADATLWFFHAVDRYFTYTGDLETLEFLLPKLVDVIYWHLRGTDFGIGVDPSDSLLRQGAIGYQLTWMDAKVDDWIVTPRRGKAVEINALWYNALRLVVEWVDIVGDKAAKNVDRVYLVQQANLTFISFQKRFWNASLGSLFDVVDSPEEKNGELVNSRDDASIRPNQVIAIALKYPVLAEEKWKSVLEVVRQELLIPVGLRSLSPHDKAYKAKYDGDLRTRDAAYHQGTAWAWLIGPFCNAWHRTYPEDTASLQAFLRGFEQHLYEDGVGTISEIFDAEPPFTPRGCMGQAWSVAEVLRCKLLVEGELQVIADKLKTPKMPR